MAILKIKNENGVFESVPSIQGEDGNSVSNIIQQYYVSTSQTEQVGGEWTTSYPTYTENNYLWYRFQITYTNPTSTGYTTAILNSEWGVTTKVSELAEQVDTNTNDILALQTGSSKIKFVSEIYGFGTSSNPITLADISSNELWYFNKGTYYVTNQDVSMKNNITLMMDEAIINIVGNSFINFYNCLNIKIHGGKINGQGIAERAFTIQGSYTELNSSGSSMNNIVEGVHFYNFGSVDIGDTCVLRIFGDCTNFTVRNCIFDTITAGVVSDDGFIHAYAILINRLSSNNTNSRIGVIDNCRFYNINGIDNGNVKADGDAIFIQAPPYLDDGEIVKPVSKISITNCYFNNCKKRAIKSASFGTNIENCIMRGEYWFACIDLQYGNANISNCDLENTSPYNGSITSCLVSAFGDINVSNCKFNATYLSESGYNSYHPAIRFDSRHSTNIIPASEKWGRINIKDCTFDGVNRAIYAYDSSSSKSYSLSEISIRDCIVGIFSENYAVSISSTRFSTIDSFEFVDFKFDYGDNRFEVQETLSNFVYPLSLSMETILYSIKYYSKFWLNEPMSGYSGLPSCPNIDIRYIGTNMGGITCKLYKRYGTTIYGNKSPSSYTSTLAKQLLYNSNLGDIHVNTSSGAMTKCTIAGTSTSIGSWSSF